MPVKKIRRFSILDCHDFTYKMLNWVSPFNIFCFLNNSNYPGSSFEGILAVGASRQIILSPPGGLNTLQAFYDEDPGWLFGHLGYAVNDSVTAIQSEDKFQPGFFFSPEILIRVTAVEVIIESGEAEPADIFAAIESSAVKPPPARPTKIDLKGPSRETYLEVIKKLQQHIQRGDCYEINYCQEFISENSVIDPLHVYNQLCTISPNPFSAFYRVGNNYCLCASPERYLKKTGRQLLSQPIKGTSSRSDDPLEDARQKQYLKESAKEKSENVMIVDLVRNDLSRVSEEGSVQVTEMCAIHSFPQVHQMISSITATMPAGMPWSRAIEATFPMGSMTGAPKKKVRELISIYESAPRGLFSGSIGYITPSGDFDFNVVIRSLFYNSSAQRLSYWAGSGITAKSQAVDEYEECVMKAAAIREVLE